MKHYRQSNGLFHEELPAVHWVSPIKQVALTEANAAELGYAPASDTPQEYGRWLIESGFYLREINAAYSKAVAAMVSGTPSFERESWPKQEQEAKAQAADSSALTPYVDTLAYARGVPRELLLSKILEKVTMYEAAHAYLTGLRQAKEDVLKALDLETVTHEQVFAIGLDFSLPGAPE